MYEIIIRAEGDLVDFHAWDDFAEALAQISELKSSAIILDLTEVQRMSSNYIGSMISTFKNCRETGRTFRLIGVRDNLYELFEMLKLTDLMDIRKA